MRKLWRNLLLKIALNSRCKVIHDNEKPYLERYFLFNLFGLKFYLHRFVASDPDRGLHNHPWKWAFSIVLFNYYIEQLESRLRLVKYFNLILKDNCHRVIKPESVNEVWTFFFHPNEYSEWGFFRDGKFVKWEPRNRKDSNKNFWELDAPLGKDFFRDENQVIIIGGVDVKTE